MNFSFIFLFQFQKKGVYTSSLFKLLIQLGKNLKDQIQIKAVEDMRTWKELKGKKRSFQDAEEQIPDVLPQF